MRNLFLCICTLISCQCGAQKDYCHDIRHDVNGPMGVASYSSPLVGRNALLSVTKTIEDTIATYSLYAGVLIKEPPEWASGIVLKLEDSTEIKSAESKLTTTAIDEGQYNLSGALDISDEDFEALCNSRILSINCGGVAHDIPLWERNLFLNYIRCLVDR